ncbi:nrm1-like protein [Sporothrix brasiliensis 5110]|uniref:Nrm1-like protein n=1 Tax=Sporothrix brasiliensis 5110 TaxID=1398154 RepID=A0A0C2ERE9_9PEZI|nr:nrm1-like protein [Sporothrix brasiliensis 5110]KIH88964.1 nrm1-like protein [Sporothrix brasiliensis 5110]
MITSTSMPSATATLTNRPDVVADRVLRRAELGKMARRLQNRLALAQFKTRHGWEDLSFDVIEPKYEDELRRKRGSDGDVMSDSSSSTSDMAYPSGRTLMSSPLKAPLFSDAIGSSNGSTGHRKRTYVASFDDLNHVPHHSGRRASYIMSSPSKRYRSSPPSNRHVSGPLTSSYLPLEGASFSGHASWKDHHQLSHSSPIKPKRQQHFTTTAGPDVSLFPGTRRIADALSVVNYNANQSSDDELLPTHSFRTSSMSLGPSTSGLTSTVAGSHATRTGSPPSTPPMRHRGLPNGNGRRKKKATGNDILEDDENNHTGLGIDQVEGAGGKSGVEGADLLLFLAASPSPANPNGRSRMDPPSTPPSKFNNLALPSSMMTTPGGGSMFPNTPGQAFDFADFVNITPSPAQKPWKTPNLLGSKTPMSVTRRRLTFDEPL